jgi:hypothetical protein
MSRRAYVRNLWKQGKRVSGLVVKALRRLWALLPLRLPLLINFATAVHRRLTVLTGHTGSTQSMACAGLPVNHLALGLKT